MEDPYLNLDPADFFNLLESNQLPVVEDIKSLIHDHLNSTKEAWLVHGLFDYSFSRSSFRAMEILLGLRESHSKHLLDKLSESIRSGPGPRLSSLIFMGFLVRRQPQWLHKISSHQVMRDLIKVLKVDNDVVILVNALLVLTALIPIIPNLEAFILADIFEGFSRLAAWNYANQPPKQPEVYLLHLQIGLYALFHRLYGMYPCNFLSHLRQHYSVREHLPVFSHTVKPMVETVRMHPLLVTASKDIEIGTARWKQMGVHDIVTECAKYSLLECQDMIQREELPCSSFIQTSLSGSDTSLTKPAPWLTEAMSTTGEWTWPAQWISVPPASSKISLAPGRIGLTPKTEPIEGQPGKIPAPLPLASSTSSAARALNLTPVSSPLPQPAQLQMPPTSPMKKDLHHAFKFPPGGGNGEPDRRGSVIGVKLQKIGQEPGASFSQFGPVLSGMRSRHSSGAPNDNRKNIIASPATHPDPLNTPPPNKFPEKEKEHISAEDREVCRLLATKPAFGPPQHNPSGKELSERDQSHALSQSWVQSREGTPSSSAPLGPPTPQPIPNRPDSLLQEKIAPDSIDGLAQQDSCEREDDEDENDVVGRHHQHSTGHSGLPPMPDQQLRISDFVQRVKRLRYFSQCLPVSSHSNQGGSPGSGSSIGTVVDSNSSFSGSGAGPTVPPMTTPRHRRKRSNSCPNLLQLDEGNSSELPSNKEETGSLSSSTVGQQQQQQQESVACQTDADLWPPTPYEHLFFSVLPPSLLFPPPPAPLEPATRPLAPAELLDRYIDAAFRNHERSTALLGKPNANEDVALLKGQVLMLQSQLQFERHRREVHAERNRRLLAKAKGVRLVEEELHTLRLQLAQAQSEMAALRRDAESLRRSRNTAEAERNAAIRQFESRTKQMLQELQEQGSLKAQIDEELVSAREEARLLRRDTGKLQAILFNADAEMAELRKRAGESHRYQQDLKESQYHLIAARETANLLQQQLINSTAAAAKFEMEELTRTFKEEVKSHSEKLDRERRQNEALSSRLVDMEVTAGRRESDMAELKRLLQVVKEEYQQVLQVAEQKYESIKSINMALENTILELRHQVEIGRSRQTRRRQIIHHQQQQQQAGMTTAASTAASPCGPGGFSASPSSPPSFSSISGTSAEQLSVSLAVEASEGLNELYWQGIDNSALVASELDPSTTSSQTQQNRP